MRALECALNKQQDKKHTPLCHVINIDINNFFFLYVILIVVKSSKRYISVFVFLVYYVFCCAVVRCYKTRIVNTNYKNKRNKKIKCVFLFFLVMFTSITSGDIICFYFCIHNYLVIYLYKWWWCYWFNLIFLFNFTIGGLCNLNCLLYCHY